MQVWMLSVFLLAGDAYVTKKLFHCRVGKSLIVCTAGCTFNYTASDSPDTLHVVHVSVSALWSTNPNPNCPDEVALSQKNFQALFAVEKIHRRGITPTQQPTNQPIIKYPSKREEWPAAPERKHFLSTKTSTKKKSDTRVSYRDTTMEDVQEDRTLESSTDVWHPQQQQANGSDHLHLFAPPTRRARGDGEMMGPILRRKKVVSLPLGHGGKTILDETSY